MASGGRKGGVMDTGVKKSTKMSKLARMNEQERVKYLERKMQEEEENKRKKEDMIHSFIKMKMGKEEKFAVINNSKLIYHWRSLQRAVKTGDLKNDISVLMDSFSKAIEKKNAHIRLLMQDLNESEDQYSIAFRSHIDIMGALEKIHHGRITEILRVHESNVELYHQLSGRERGAATKDQDAIRSYLGDIAIATNQRHCAILDQFRHAHSQLKEETRNKNMEEQQALQMHLEEAVENLWCRLQRNLHSHRSGTEEKRRIYQDLLAKDQRGVAEVMENNTKINKLMVCVNLYEF